MATPPDVEGVGLGELIQQLVGETFEAITASQVEQQRQREELLSLAALSTEDYAAREVGEEAVDSCLGRLFPSASQETSNAIGIGSPYRPATEEADEDPPIRAVTGIRLAVGDFAEVSSKPACRHALMAPGVAAVRAWARRELAQHELTALRDLARTGIPRVAVQKGRLQVKATFSLDPADSPAGGDESRGAADAGPRTAASDRRAPEPAAERGRRSDVLGHRLRSVLRGGAVEEAGPRPAAQRRLLVHPADERRADVRGLAVDVFGAVELEFVLRD
jgi:hypothetical protein